MIYVKNHFGYKIQYFLIIKAKKNLKLGENILKMLL